MKPVALTRQTLRKFPLPHPGGEGKDGHGSVLSVAGGAACPGALLLCAEAAMRAGAGKLKVAATQLLGIAMGPVLQEALMVDAPTSADGEFAARPGKALLAAARASDSLIAGPGMLDKARAWPLARALLRAAPDLRAVVDAAAMTGCAGDETAPALFAGRVVLTPHAGEIASLMGCSREEAEADPLALAHAACARFQAVVIMKGATSFVVAPGGEAWVHQGGVAGLGISGSGDVLAGLIGGLLARGCPPAQAALWAVWLHGAAGEALSRRIGPLGFLAREISPVVPGLMAGR